MHNPQATAMRSEPYWTSYTSQQFQVKAQNTQTCYVNAQQLELTKNIAAITIAKLLTIVSILQSRSAVFQLVASNIHNTWQVHRNFSWLLSSMACQYISNRATSWHDKFNKSHCITAKIQENAQRNWRNRPWHHSLVTVSHLHFLLKC